MSPPATSYKLLQLVIKWVIGAIYMGAALTCLADASYTPMLDNAIPRITISGHIKQDDLKNFVTLSRIAQQEWRNKGSKGAAYLVVLNSLGGDVEAALSIGRTIRLDQALVNVGSDGCFSSCVFVLAGGAFRRVEGPVGIHRPFAPDDLRTTASSQKQNYGRLEKKVKAYLKAMNVPGELYDHMIRIPPDAVKILNEDELQRYGLSEDDPYENAAQIAIMAKIMGITSQEYIRRQAKSLSECSSKSGDEYMRCYTRIMGI